MARADTHHFVVVRGLEQNRPVGVGSFRQSVEHLPEIAIGSIGADRTAERHGIGVDQRQRHTGEITMGINHHVRQLQVSRDDPGKMDPRQQSAGSGTKSRARITCAGTGNTPFSFCRGPIEGTTA